MIIGSEVLHPSSLVFSFIYIVREKCSDFLFFSFCHLQFNLQWSCFSLNREPWFGMIKMPLRISLPFPLARSPDLHKPQIPQLMQTMLAAQVTDSDNTEHTRGSEYATQGLG